MIIPNLLPNLLPILPSILVPLVGLLLPTITMVLSHLYIQNDEILSNYSINILTGVYNKLSIFLIGLGSTVFFAIR